MDCLAISDRKRLYPGIQIAAAMWLLTAFAVGAAEVTWTGTVDSAWSNAANWDGGVPGLDDIAIVPLTTNQPAIDAPDTVCAGVVLEEDATLSLLTSGNPSAPNALYIIGDGDLDGDGWSDGFERDESIAYGNFDFDGDGLPNFADADADNDGIPDACEIQYMDEHAEFHPYFPAELLRDFDGDGYSDAEECAEGTDPTASDDRPTAMPMLDALGLAILGIVLLALSIRILRRLGARSRGILCILLVVTLLSLGAFHGSKPLMASPFYDFAQGDRLESAALDGTPGSTLAFSGASVRPWNGQSSYLNRPRILQAVDGPIFLGGMRSAIQLGVLGQGSLNVESAYGGPDHPFPVSIFLPAGSKESPAFRGERVALTSTPESGWGFHGWAGDAAGTANPLNLQVLADELEIAAVFGPPGPDLAATVDTGPPSVLYAGDVIAVDVEVENIGLSDTDESSWNDGLYLSRDTVFDEADLELDVNAHSGKVIAGGDYTTSFSATLSDVAPGRYYVLAVSDSGNQATDVNGSNNVAAVEVSVLDVNLAQ